EVGDRDGGLEVERSLERFLPVAGHGDLVPPAREDRGQSVARVLLVISHQYAMCHGTAPMCFRLPFLAEGGMSRHSVALPGTTQWACHAPGGHPRRLRQHFPRDQAQMNSGASE